jgi:hypothetical protein
VNAFTRTLVISSLLGASLLAGPMPAQADDYWDGYWSWYDTTYRPYYYRQYRRSYVQPVQPVQPGYGYTYAPGYSYGYRPGAYYSDYYSPGWSRGYGAYYGTPNAGYSDFGPYGGQVRVGPLRFGWR